MLQVWSVPFITIKRRLGTVEVSDDDEHLITIKEDGGATKIYIRKGTSMSDQPRVNFELLEYFNSLFKIDAKHKYLANYLMSAAVPDLPEIMERHDISLPEDFDPETVDDQCSDGEHDVAVTVHRTAARHGADLSLEPATGSSDVRRFTALERRFGNLEVSTEADDDHAAFVAPPRSPHLQPLQGLVSLRRARTARTFPRALPTASHFQMYEPPVAIAPVPNHHSYGAFYQPLATRIWDNYFSGRGLPPPGHPYLGVDFHGNLTGRHTTMFSGSHLGSYEVPPAPSKVPWRYQKGDIPMRNGRYEIPPAPNQIPWGYQDGGIPMRSFRYEIPPAPNQILWEYQDETVPMRNVGCREIGFLGELFVNHPKTSP